MKQISGIFLLILYMVGMLRPVLPYLEYAINQKHIATELCINHDKPELKCNGHCYLMQQLKAMAVEQGSELPSEVPPVLSVEEVLSVHIVDPYALFTALPQQLFSFPPEADPLTEAIYLGTVEPPPKFS